MKELAKSKGMQVVEYNSEAIKKNPTLPVDLGKLLNKTKGVCVIATKVAEVGFNGNIDVCFSFDKDTDRIFTNRNGDLYNEVSIVPLTLASYIQRRGRVGRNKPGKFVFCGELPTIVENHALLSHFCAELRLSGIGDYRSNASIINYIRNRVNFEDLSAERKCCMEASWHDDPLDFIKHVDPRKGKYNQLCDHFKAVTEDRYAEGAYKTDYEAKIDEEDWDAHEELVRTAQAAYDLDEAINRGSLDEEHYQHDVFRQEKKIRAETECDKTLKELQYLIEDILRTTYPIMMLIPAEYSKLENKVKNLNDQFNFWNTGQKNISMCKSTDFFHINTENRDFMVSVFEDLTRVDYETVKERLINIYQHCKTKRFSNIILIDQIVSHSMLKSSVIHKMLSAIFHDI